METNFKRVPTLYPKEDERVILSDLYAGGPKLKKEQNLFKKSFTKV